MTEGGRTFALPRLKEPDALDLDNMPEDIAGGIAADRHRAHLIGVAKEAQGDTTSRKRRKHARPVPYGETGGPFFDPQEIEQIRQGGDKPVYFFGFLAAHDIHVKPEGKRHVTKAIEERLRQRNLYEIFFRDEKSKRVLFRARDIREVVEAISNARLEIISHVKGWPEIIPLVKMIIDDQIPQVVARKT